MDVVDIREIVSAATHGAALIAAIPGVVALVRRVRPDRARMLALLVYGVGLVACFGASTSCHALCASGHESRIFIMIDHMAIYLLIAGTYTPLVVALLPAPRRRETLGVIWLAAGIGMALNLMRGPLPAWLATSFYLAMGWGGLWCYFGIRPALSHRQLAPIPFGGALYSVGAVAHVARWPVLWPGVFGPHELFHLFVVAGAATHFAFILTHVAIVTRPECPPSRDGRPTDGYPAASSGHRPAVLRPTARRRWATGAGRSSIGRPVS